jgi:hypothetical protein
MDLLPEFCFLKRGLDLANSEPREKLKGYWIKGDLFSANLFPTDVSRGVHTFEVPGPELKRVLVVPSQTGSHQIWVRSKGHEGHV